MDEQKLTGYLFGGLGFLSQGLLGFYVDSSEASKKAFKVLPDEELQPLFLNVWFVGFGVFTLWLGTKGLAVIEALNC